MTAHGHGDHSQAVEDREHDACGVGFVASASGPVDHGLVDIALTAIERQEHRGALGADGESGDGAGILTAVPWRLLERELASAGARLAPWESLAIGMLFLPRDEAKRRLARQLVEKVLTDEAFSVTCWRTVPVRPEVLGPLARRHRPHIEQIIVSSPHLRGEQMERSLLLARRGIGKALQRQSVVRRFDDLYVCSLSSRTIVYKGMVRGGGLGDFYSDLRDPAFLTRFAVFHRRFSTNTLPKWSLAQPMRLLAHNGEINTLPGNLTWTSARDEELEHRVWGERVVELLPTVHADGSDSGSLDKMLELLVRSGRDPLEALMMMIPEAYEGSARLAVGPATVDFYEYFSAVQEAWDGPAMVAFGDGVTVGACVDRNGLRPARYVTTHDGLVLVASEAGVSDLGGREIVAKGQLGPGQMLAVDLQAGSVLGDAEIKSRVASRRPYGRWLREQRLRLPHVPAPRRELRAEELLQLQTAFGYTAEDVEVILRPMGLHGREPVFSMGDDIPLAVLSDKPHTLYDYFKERFAQVTNPPIDPLRERLVMSLAMPVGRRGNVLDASPRHARAVKLASPLLDETQLEGLARSGLEVARLSTLFAVSSGPWGLRDAVERLCRDVVAAVRSGAEVVILSDRLGEPGVDLTYVPPLLAAGAAHHRLLDEGLRCRASLVVDSAQCWSVHHVACLVSYGASAVCPYLAFETVRGLATDTLARDPRREWRDPAVPPAKAVANYRAALESGLLTVLSKVGISLLASYHGAQLQEAVGIGDDLLALAFAGTTSRVGGLSVEELAQETIWTHQRAFPELTVERLQNYGFVRYRSGGEHHVNTPEVAKTLRRAVVANDATLYEDYRRALVDRPCTTIRDLLELRSERAPIAVTEVEPAERIMQRFCTGGMSLGALSVEAHETLAIAMNRLGGKANSGEGGEDPARREPLEDVDESGRSARLPGLTGLRNGDRPATAIRQVASGRFGVTAEYLVAAEQIEIKVAQGAKPGEGGQLPGDKVTPFIAQLRGATPGTTLISPPPHHDIYSIEDLAQLIFDLRRVNPAASICVKLAAGPGVGTIAAGVAKAGADVIHIAGHSGGTAAAALNSIKHTGIPWELGLTEAHRQLSRTRLRSRVALRVDGDLRTGRDVVVAAAMGAQEFAFGSVAMMAEGCIMARVCHTNDCPAGVATQREDLRRRFAATPEHVVNLFRFIAEDVRALLAALGFRSLEELIGRSELLAARADRRLTKTTGIDTSWLSDAGDNGGLSASNAGAPAAEPAIPRAPPAASEPGLDEAIATDPRVRAALETHGRARLVLSVANADRSVGAGLAGRIAALHGDRGFKGDIAVELSGTAGQSFGAFLLPGMRFRLVGDANDYVGKGMAGGEIVLVPPGDAAFDPSRSLIAGNTCLYGATGGSLFAHGLVGQRFAVRNSGASAVVEGAGHHCCEYMTAGTVVVLGEVGPNACAGMTGGLAFLLDEDGSVAYRVNLETVTLRAVAGSHFEGELRERVAQHLERTDSPRAAAALASWDCFVAACRVVVPR